MGFEPMMFTCVHSGSQPDTFVHSVQHTHVAVTVGFTPTSPLVLYGALFTYATLTMFGVIEGARTLDLLNHNQAL